jgi:methylated-DNA-[protein]-cysteine S-methyltransferase
MRTGTLSIQIDRLKTPIGEMLIVSDRVGSLRAVDWSDCEQRMQRLLQIHYGSKGFRIKSSQSKSKALTVLDHYFQGAVAEIRDLVVETGGSAFQRNVWRALRSIRCGTTMSYAALAEQVGRPAVVRAVGMANPRNPVGVVVPCHRVVGADGSLTGYAGGLDRKLWLLKHEANGMQECRVKARHRFQLGSRENMKPGPG